ncbi:MAG: NAD(P)H-binding protein [Coriobacteriia bacterium]|nr:NAD(P)H-binding protein [Coriobacteriia bacterium]
MRLLVVGASGRTGRLLVAQALGHGHDVTAFVRDANDITSGERLAVAAGDAADPAALAFAVEGQDAVISVLAPRRGEPASIYADGTANLVRAMTTRGVDRLVVASAAGLGGHKSELPLPYQALLLLPRLQRDYEAMEPMEGEVMLSDLEWTIVRAAVLSNKQQTGHYRVVEGPVVPKGLRISRADLAALLLKIAETGRYGRRVVAAAY